MSVIQKVILLNKPLKIFEFTPFQLVLMVLSVIAALLLGGKVPAGWKVGNLPAGFIVGLLVVCGAIVFVKASEVKPGQWWRNRFLYSLKFLPRQYFPSPEPAEIYPDATIIDTGKRNQSSEFYITEDPSRSTIKKGEE
jgi:hypothetical protein